MPKVVYVACPHCGKEFYVGKEFLEIEESYCHCPYCSQEFKPEAARRAAGSLRGGLPSP